MDRLRCRHVASGGNAAPQRGANARRGRMDAVARAFMY